jgi:hypothetical protein
MFFVGLSSDIERYMHTLMGPRGSFMYNVGYPAILVIPKYFSIAVRHLQPALYTVQHHRSDSLTTSSRYHLISASFWDHMLGGSTVMAPIPILPLASCRASIKLQRQICLTSDRCFLSFQLESQCQSARAARNTLLSNVRAKAV